MVVETLKGKRCPDCSYFTMFPLKGILRCSECGFKLCEIYGEPCRYDLEQSIDDICHDCFKQRVNESIRDRQPITREAFKVG